MTNDRTDFSDRLIAVKPLSAESRQNLQQELSAMFIRELTMPRRIIFGIVATVALGSATVCGYLALTEPGLPLLARVGLGTGTLFGLTWTAMAARLARRGAVDLKRDSSRIAGMVWTFTVLMMVFLLMLGMSIEDRMLGLMMIANGLAFLIGAAVYWLTHRIEQAELGVRERLLQLELRLAQLSEKPAAAE